MAVLTKSIDTSDADLMLDSLFETEEALKAYHSSEHVRVAKAYVRPVTKNRKCLDFYENFQL